MQCLKLRAVVLAQAEAEEMLQMYEFIGFEKKLMKIAAKITRPRRPSSPISEPWLKQVQISRPVKRRTPTRLRDYLR